MLTDGRLAGIVTPKDVLFRVVAKGLNPDRTPVSAIMTPNPDTVPPEMTAVEALGEASFRICQVYRIGLNSAVEWRH